MRCTIRKGDVSRKACDCQIFSILSEFYNRVSMIDNRWIIARNVDLYGNDSSTLIIGDDYFRLNNVKYPYDCLKCITKQRGNLQILMLSVCSLDSDLTICVNVVESM